MTSIQDKIKSLRETVNVQYRRPPMEKIEKFQQALWNCAKAKDYLQNERGFSNDTIEHFQLGYDEDKDAIAIPVFKTINGKEELISIKYRFLNPDKQKYTTERGCETWIYNEQGIQRGLGKGFILIVEGEFDLMSAWQAGFKSVISPASGKDSYGVWIELLDNIPTVYIAYDNDEAGKGTAIKIAERLGVDKCYEVTYPDGIKDANEYFKKYTRDEFKELVKGSRPYYRYQFTGIGDIINSLRNSKPDVVKTQFFPDVELEKDWLVVVSGRSNAGKCHGKGTKILMSDGKIKNVEDIKVGDFVMGEDSKPKKVLSLARGIDELYKVNERDDSYVVNSEHILSLVQRTNKKNTNIQYSKYVELSVKDYLNKSEAFKNSYRGWKVGVEFEEKELVVDPYLFGLWLGDGASSKTEITTMDSEIKQYIENYCDKNGHYLNTYGKKNNRAKTYAICSTRGQRNKLRQAFIKMDVLNNKHIPFEYLTSSREQRLQLLAGLIDTDGSLCKCRGEYYEIIQKNNRLSEDIKYLVRSLGFRIVSRKSTKTIKSTGFSGEYNRMTIVGDLSQIPVKLERKKSNGCSKKQWLTSKINVESIGKGEYYGFTLDGNGLYLLATFTVTHNSSFVLNIADELVKNKIPVLVMPFERGNESIGKRFMQIKFDKTIRDFEIATSDEWDKIIDECIDTPIYFSVPKKDEVIETIIKSKKIFNTQVVIVDHLDYLVRHVNGNREAEIANTLQDLKRIAEEHKIIMIIVTHIRKIDQAGAEIARKPNIEDLKGSASLYQDPECVIMIHNDGQGTLDVNVLKNKGLMKEKAFNFNPITGKLTEDQLTNF